MVSEWTVDTLKEHVDVRFAAAEKAVDAALASSKEAVVKAEKAAEKRFDAANEFRGQLSDQAATFMPRLESEQRMAQFVKDIDDLRQDRNVRRGHTSGVATSWGFLIGAAGVVGIIFAVASRFI
jgi:hypothetical protein